MAPALAAASPEPSVEPSSQTRTVLACSRAPRTTAAIFRAWSYTGMITQAPARSQLHGMAGCPDTWASCPAGCVPSAGDTGVKADRGGPCHGSACDGNAGACRKHVADTRATQPERVVCGLRPPGPRSAGLSDARTRQPRTARDGRGLRGDDGVQPFPGPSATAGCRAGDCLPAEPHCRDSGGTSLGSSDYGTGVSGQRTSWVDHAARPLAFPLP